MLKLFDTHCHFETANRDEIAAQLERARAVGVEQVMAVGGSLLLNESARVASSLGCPMALGVDRDQQELGEPLPDEALANATLLGEIGIDYHYSPETRDFQLRLFAAQLEQAKRLNLPVSIHTREADDDTLALLRQIPARGIIHCFTGSPAFAKALLDLGFYISISGIVTFKAAANVRESALVVPDDRILIETDSPYLAPVPMRGNANEPAFIRHTCEFLAKLRGMPAEEFANLTFTNAQQLLCQTSPKGIR